jgi:hypothetical protein
MITWLCAVKKDEPWLPELERLRERVSTLVRQLDRRVPAPKSMEQHVDAKSWMEGARP